MELVPLKIYIEKNNIKTDQVAKYEFYVRCSSLFLYTSNLMKSPNMLDMKKNFIMLANIYLLKIKNFPDFKEDAINKKNINYEFKNKIIAFIKSYEEIGNNNYVSHGEYLTNIHFDDAEVCNDLAKKEF